MTYVDHSGSYTVPLRCPVPGAGTGHSYKLYDDGGACQYCGAEPGTAADTWPCGATLPHIRVEVDERGLTAGAYLYDAVDAALITDVLDQADRVRYAESNDEEHEAAMDLLCSIENLVSHLPTT